MTKIFLAALGVIAVCGPAFAAGPTSLGVFSDWTAAQYGSGPGQVCYAFTHAIGSGKAPAGAMLLVSERATTRDEVVVDAPAPYPPKTEVGVQIDTQAPMSFYTSGRSAFSRDGRAAVIDMQKGSTAMTSWDQGKHTDKFSLAGFSAAYAAIVKGCPAK